MKYTLFGFNQALATEINLDLTDLALLRWFVDFKDARREGKPLMFSKIINDDKYYWVKYEGVLEEFPILNIKSKDGVYRRFKKLVNANILKHEVVKQGGVYSYYTLGDKYYDLISDYVPNNDINNKKKNETPNPTDENPTPTDENPNHTDTNPEQNIHLLYPSTTIPPLPSSSKEEIEEEDSPSDLDFLLDKCRMLNLNISKKDLERLLIAYTSSELIKCLVLIPSSAKSHIAYLKTILVNNAKKNINQITQVVNKDNVKPVGSFASAKENERPDIEEDIKEAILDNSWGWED